MPFPLRSITSLLLATAAGMVRAEVPASPKPTQANVPYSPVALGEPWKDPPHSANFGAGLVEKLKKIGVEYEFNYTGATGVKHPDIFGFLLEKLHVSPPK